MKISNTTNDLINQLIGVIDQLRHGEYSQPLEMYNGSSVGMHFRHIYDFYGCIINECRNGKVDYAHRDRESDLENNPDSMIDKLNWVKKGVVELNESDEVEIYSDFEFDDESRAKVKSSIGRELLYAYDHAVHHLAIIKLGINQAFPHILVDQNMGVASSTIRYKERNTFQH